ncbi:NAD(P)-dependent oxidoreductase [Nonomuraea sediminis]|uniref:NAD(P)-dependent oxidoreductase n=1 Tax=Nonomuraea sediminis TaxID=2835864 RepID=UPI001BDC23E5|nr:NAD(P)-binding domain-containing protein [Nonomuraea sediminis]
MSESVVVLGLGLMGRALARTLAEAGHPVTVWNRTPGRAPELDVARAETPAQAVAAARLVIACLLDYPSVYETLDGVDLEGKVLVNLTTGRPSEAREAAGWAAERGAEYLDGGIMAVPQMIGGPGASILYSGSREAFDRYRAVLEPLAVPSHLGEDPGMASLQDLAMLTGMYGQIAGFLQAAALVESQGVGVVEFTQTRLVPWMRSMLELLPAWARDIEAKSYATEVSNLEINASGLVNLARAFEEQGVTTELLAPLRDLMARRVARGHGDQSLSSLFEELHPDLHH